MIVFRPAVAPIVPVAKQALFAGDIIGERSVDVIAPLSELFEFDATIACLSDARPNWRSRAGPAQSTPIARHNAHKSATSATDSEVRDNPGQTASSQSDDPKHHPPSRRKVTLLIRELLPTREMFRQALDPGPLRRRSSDRSVQESARTQPCAAFSGCPPCSRYAVFSFESESFGNALRCAAGSMP